MTIEIVEFFHNLQNGFLDLFFNLISFLGEEYVYIVLMIIIYYGVNKKLGERIAFSLITATAFNTMIKETFQRPRPYQKYPDRITNLRDHTSSGFSFPSGHTQIFTSVVFTVGFYLKKKILYIVFFILGMLMAISRMYLGVHFFEDVITSLILGISYAYIVNWFFNKYADNHKVLNRVYLSMLAILVMLLFVLRTKTYITTVGMYSGFVLAMYYEKTFVNFSITSNMYHKIIRVVSGIIVMIGLQLGLKVLFGIFTDNESLLLVFDFIRYFLLVFVGLGLFPKLFGTLNI